MSPLVSVVVPLFEGRRWVEGCLESLRAQTHREFEALLVDDGSRDPAEDLLAPFLKDGRFKYVRKEHEGIPRTRNRALSLAKGDYVAFLDQDDLYLPGKLRAQVEALEADPAAWVCYCGVERIDEAGASLGERVLPAAGDGRLFDAFLERGVAVPLLSVMVRREAATEVGPLDEDLFGTDDLDWLLRLADRGRFIEVRQALVRQRFRAGTAGQSEPMYQDRFRLVQKMRRAWPQRSDRLDRFEAASRYLYGSWLLSAGRGGESRAQFARAWSLRRCDWRAAVKWGLSWTAAGRGGP